MTTVKTEQEKSSNTWLFESHRQKIQEGSSGGKDDDVQDNDEDEDVELIDDGDDEDIDEAVKSIKDLQESVKAK